MRSSPATRSIPACSGALAAARELHGVEVREVPLRELADAIGPRTRLVACSHVGWMSGCSRQRSSPASMCRSLLDGAQGVGAIAVDVRALGCDAYAGAGQKWLCGPDGTGMLYVSPDLRERLAVPRRGYANLADPNEGLDARLHEDARRLDTLSLNAETRGLRAGGGRRARVRRLGCGTRARALAGRAVWQSCSPSTAASRHRAVRRRSCPSRAPTRPPSASDSPKTA